MILSVFLIFSLKYGFSLMVSFLSEDCVSHQRRLQAAV